MVLDDLDHCVRSREARGLVGPSIKRQLSERNTVRLYAFDDLVVLLVASALVAIGLGECRLA